MTESQHTPNTNITNRECSIQDAIQVSLMIACCMKLKVATYSRAVAPLERLCVIG